jgi:hypothetical protein
VFLDSNDLLLNLQQLNVSSKQKKWWCHILCPPLSSELLLQLAVDAFVPALSDVEFGEYVLEGKQSWAGFV